MATWLFVGIVAGKMAGGVRGDSDNNRGGGVGVGYSENGKIIHYKASGAPSIELL
ncbi:unnamed protein product, partial [marine sediment metagenome]